MEYDLSVFPGKNGNCFHTLVGCQSVNCFLTQTSPFQTQNSREYDSWITNRKQELFGPFNFVFIHPPNMKDQKSQGGGQGGGGADESL